MKRFSIWILLIELYIFWWSWKWFECTVGGFKQELGFHIDTDNGKIGFGKFAPIKSFRALYGNELIIYVLEKELATKLIGKLVLFSARPRIYGTWCTMYLYIQRYAEVHRAAHGRPLNNLSCETDALQSDIVCECNFPWYCLFFGIFRSLYLMINICMSLSILRFPE